MKEAIKNYILEKAKKVFSEKGFEKATMKDISIASEISKPTLYNYFSSKEKLFFSVLKNINKEIDEEIIPIIIEKGNIKNKLKQIIKKSLLFAFEHKDIICIAFFEAQLIAISKKSKDEKNKVKKFIKEQHHEIFDKRSQRINAIKKYIEKAQERGEIRDDIDAEILTLSMGGLLKENIFNIIFHKENKESIDIITEKLLKIITDGILRRKNEK